MSTSDNGNGALVPIDFECDLSIRYTPEAVQTRSYRSAFGDAFYIRVRVRFGGHFIIEDKYGAERGGSLANSSSGDTIGAGILRLDGLDDVYGRKKKLWKEKEGEGIGEGMDGIGWP